MDLTEERHTKEKISFLFCKIFSKRKSQKFITKILQNKKARHLRVNHRGTEPGLLPHSAFRKLTVLVRLCPVFCLQVFQIRARVTPAFVLRYPACE